MAKSLPVRDQKTGDYKIEGGAVTIFGAIFLVLGLVALGVFVYSFALAVDPLAYVINSDDAVFFFVSIVMFFCPIGYLLPVGILFLVAGGSCLKRHSARGSLVGALVLSIIALCTTPLLAVDDFRADMVLGFPLLKNSIIVLLMVAVPIALSIVGIASLPKAPARVMPFAYPGAYPYGTGYAPAPPAYGGYPYPQQGGIYPPAAYPQQPYPGYPYNQMPVQPGQPGGYPPPPLPGTVPYSPAVPTQPIPQSDPTLIPVSPQQAANPFAAPASPQVADPFAAPAAPQVADPFAAPAAPQAADPFAAPAAPQAADPFAAPVAPPAADPFAAPAAPQAADPFAPTPRPETTPSPFSNSGTAQPAQDTPKDPQ